MRHKSLACGTVSMGGAASARVRPFCHFCVTLRRRLVGESSNNAHNGTAVAQGRHSWRPVLSTGSCSYSVSAAGRSSHI